MTEFKGKTNLVLSQYTSSKTVESPKAELKNSGPAPLPPPSEGHPNFSNDSWNNLLNGRTTQAALNPFLIDAAAPGVDSFRGPIYVPHLYRDIYSKFPHAKTSSDIPHRAIIVKYDALIKTFRAMVKDLRLIMKGGKIKPSEAPAIHARIAELNKAITQAEAFKRQAENEFNKSLESAPPEPQEA